MLKNILYIIFPFLLVAQTEPNENLQKNSPRVWTLTNGMIHTAPGDFIKGGSIVIRDGKIEAVGRYIKSPKDAYEINLEGAHVYAGFIESWLETKSYNDKSKTKRRHWDLKVRPDYRSVDNFDLKEKDLKVLRSLGFTSAQLAPTQGIFRGQTGIVSLSDSPRAINSSIAQVIDFKYRTKGTRTYPRSLLGVIAHIRQTFYDSDWYLKAQEVVQAYPTENEPISSNSSLESLGLSRALNKPFIFVSSNENSNSRAMNISKEFGLTPWILGGGYEYRNLESFADIKPFFIIPINFPSKPNVAKYMSDLQYSTKELKHWDIAPDNLLYLFNANHNFSITSHGLKKKSDFRKHLQKIIDRGLNKDIVLASLTTIPAEALGLEKSNGKIARGYNANLVIVDGEYFDPKSKVVSVWVEGKEIYISSKKTPSFLGEWSLKYDGTAYELKIVDLLKDQTNNIENKIYSGSIYYQGKTIDLYNIDIFESSISFSINGTLIGHKGSITFNGELKDDQIIGMTKNTNIDKSSFQADRKTKDNSKELKPESRSSLSVYKPEGAYGLIKKHPKPNAILINDATLWTCGPKGTLAEWDILFVDGKIEQVAPDITVPQGSAVVIEGAGKHITPGLIDCHSHSAASSINEGTQYITSEVRMRDVIDPNDINIYRQLGGGLTTANVLHGSANPIGGQNVVIKLRWGSNANELIFKNAPEGIKFALGENVKQANWSGTNRYPQTRMGVEQVIRDAFRAALDYKHANENYSRNSKNQRTKTPPRKDLELDALVEILEGKRLVHCHSYRQDEILMLTRVAEDFGFKIATFQHVLEGYKVADRIAEHGAGASTFSDWWQYKYEVIDAIPYNGSMMTKSNVLVSYNSDDDELARRLNTEAAKAIQYGELSPNEALKLVTINPAKQLKIDKYVGSLEPKKDADFVIWDGEPLSIYSKVEETWIDGIRYFSQTDNKMLEERDYQLRKDLIQKILSTKGNGSSTSNINNSSLKNHEGHSCDIIDNTGVYDE